MLLTEEEARKKWCPMARFQIDAQGFGPANRFEPGSYANAQTFCIASDCMMWRFVGERRAKGADAPAHITSVAYERGFCGLSGKPES